MNDDLAASPRDFSVEQLRVMRRLADELAPQGDGLPKYSAVDSNGYALQIARQYVDDRFNLADFALTTALDSDDYDECLGTLERDHPAAFQTLRLLVLSAYLSTSVGWSAYGARISRVRRSIAEERFAERS